MDSTEKRSFLIRPFSIPRLKEELSEAEDWFKMLNTPLG